MIRNRFSTNVLIPSPRAYNLSSLLLHNLPCVFNIARQLTAIWRCVQCGRSELPQQIFTQQKTRCTTDSTCYKHMNRSVEVKQKKNQLLPFRTSRNWRRKENERKNKKNEKRNKLNIDFTIVKNQTQLKFSDRLSNTSSHSIFRFFFFSSFPRRSVGEKLMIFHFTFIQFNFTSSIQAEWWWLCRFPTLNSP